MARTIRNDDVITINRKYINADGQEEIQEVNIGRYYFEASRGLKECTMQIYLDEEITNEEEIQQIKDIYIREYNNFVNDTNSYGWSVLDIKNEP